MKSVIVSAVLVLSSFEVASMPILFNDRALFTDSIGTSINDDYSSYGAPVGGSVNLTNIEMSQVLGETRYESISFSDLNLVGDVYLHGDGTNYCAGCNGNFSLFFDDTSLSENGGVYGVGVDLVLHTSRRGAIGDVTTGETSVSGIVRVEYTDGQLEDLFVPADIGFFGPESYFLGIIDDRGIKSLTVGTEPLSQRHRWVIDNLTIASAAVPEPGALTLLGAGLIAFRLSTRTNNARSDEFR